MSRRIKADNTESFRAVVTTHRPAVTEGPYQCEEYTAVDYYGPYQTKGAAKAAIKRESRVSHWSWDRGVTKTGKVQRSTVVWEDVEE